MLLVEEVIIVSMMTGCVLKSQSLGNDSLVRYLETQSHSDHRLEGSKEISPSMWYHCASVLTVDCLQLITFSFVMKFELYIKNRRVWENNMKYFVLVHVLGDQ